MSRMCDLSGKIALVGNNVSHSKRRTKRKFQPNLHKKKFYVQELDEYITLKVSVSTMRTINKKGIYNCLKEVEKYGYLK